MNATKILAACSGILLACLMSVSQAAYAGVAGYAQFVNGNVRIESLAGQMRTLQKGGAVNEGDTVISAQAASAQIRMQDGGFIAVRPNTSLKFDKFKFDGKDDGSARSFFSLFKGGFRAITGLIGRLHKSNYRITTASSTIGIRGTDHETFVVTPDSPLAKITPVGTYNKVNVGETSMTTDKGTIFVLPNQMGFAGAADQMPQLRPLNTNIFTAVERPSKEAKVDNKETKEGARTAEAKTEDKEVRAIATVDNTAEEVVAAAVAAPAVETASSTGIGVDENILQPITTTNGIDLTGGSTAPAATGGTYAAYNSNHIAVETAGGLNFSSGMMAAPADLVYVAGGTSTSGALQSMTFRDFGGGGNYTSTSTISGGTATSADAPAFATTGIQYGAWTGYTGESGNWSQSLGGKNGGAPDSWMYGPEGYLDAIYLPSTSAGLSGAMAGTFTYQMDGATAPKSQNTGLTGTLSSATFSVDFVNMVLSGNMALTMPGNENWGASVSNVPITVGSPFYATPVVTYGVGVPAATCATCSGNVNGMFTGQNFAGAILSYDLYNNAPMAGGDVSGNVALTRVGVAGNATVANGTAVPTGNIVVATTGQNGSGSSSVSTYPVASSTTTGNLLTAYGSTSIGNGYSSSYSTTVTCTTCTTNPSGQVATSGIYYGTWDAGTYASSFSSTFPAGTMAPSYWITGPEAGPLYLPQALTGTASYTFDAGQVNNYAGVAGAVLPGTTALTLDFSKQTVGINLDVSIADTATTPAVHAWNVTTLPGNEAVLGEGQGIGGAAFYASTYNNGGGSGLLTVSVDGSTANVTSPNASINGQLTGTGLTGAIMNFNLGGTLNAATAAPTYENINGVAAFTGTAQAVATPHQYVSMSLADPFSPVPLPVLGFYANAQSRITTDASGNLTQFDIQAINNNGGGSSSTVANVSAVNADLGTDPVSGISWGRWAGGGVNVTDRATGIVSRATLKGSLHWITEPVATSAVTLPTSGTYTYTNAGGTSPTDNLGNVGTLNSATLSANFTAQTVDVGVNATVAGATLDAVGTSVPIIQNTVFYASSQEPATSTSHLAVGCSGSPCGATGGVVIGKFTGAGAIGAAVTYGLNNGATTISGVTAFHR
jgi:hypothetical protein